METYGRAGATAEEALGAIRTVVAFGGERIEMLNSIYLWHTLNKSGA